MLTYCLYAYFCSYLHHKIESLTNRFSCLSYLNKFRSCKGNRCVSSEPSPHDRLVLEYLRLAHTGHLCGQVQKLVDSSEVRNFYWWFSLPCRDKVCFVTAVILCLWEVGWYVYRSQAWVNVGHCYVTWPSLVTSHCSVTEQWLRQQINGWGSGLTQRYGHILVLSYIWRNILYKQLGLRINTAIWSYFGS